MKKWILSAVLVIMMMTLPQWLGWFGVGVYERFLALQVGGSWHIDSLSCRWFGQQVAKGVTWKQGEATLLDAEVINLNDSLAALFGFGYLRSIHIHKATTTNAGIPLLAGLFLLPQLSLEEIRIQEGESSLLISHCLYERGHSLTLTGYNDQGDPLICTINNHQKVMDLSLPTSYLDRIVGRPIPSLLCGERFALHCSDEEAFKVSIESPLCKVEGVGSYQEALRLDTLSISLELVPSILKNIAPAFPLLYTSSCTIQCHDVILPFQNLAFLTFQGSAILEEVVLEEKEERSVLETITCEFAKGEHSFFRFESTQQNFQGALDTSPLRFTTDITLPLILSDRWIPLHIQGKGGGENRFYSEWECAAENFSWSMQVKEKKTHQLQATFHGHGSAHNIPWHIQGKASGKTNPFFAITHIQGEVSTPQGTATLTGAIGNNSHPASLQNTFFLIHSKHIETPLAHLYAQIHALYQGTTNKMVVKASLIDATHPWFKRQKGELIAYTEDINTPLQLLNQPLWHLQGHGKHLPTQLLPPSMVWLQKAGPWLDIQMKGSYRAEEKALALEGNITSEDLSMQGTLSSLDPERLRASGSFHIHLTQEKYRSLFPSSEPPLLLIEAPHIDIECEQIDFPWHDFEWCHLALTGYAHIDHIALFHSHSHQHIDTSDITAQFRLEEGFSTLYLEVKGSVFSSHIPVTENPYFYCKLQGEQLCHDNTFDLSHGILSLETKGFLLPMPPLIDLFPLHEGHKEALSSLFGDLLTISCIGHLEHLSGYIDCSVQATNAKINLPFLIEEGVIHLKEDVHGEVKLTNHMSYWMNDVVPFLPPSVQSTNPVHLYIKKEGFSLTALPFSLSSLSIPWGAIDFGQIEVQNTGNLKELFSFLKIPSSQETVEVWITPIFFQFNQGRLHYRRFDLLINRDIPLASWGEVDLIQDNIRMTVALHARTLQKHFKLLALSKNAYFLLHIKGSTSAPKVDWSQAYGRIAMLITRLAGGYIGYFVGGVVEQAFGINDESVPSPTTSPFPWEHEVQRDPSLFPEIAKGVKKKGSTLERALKFLIP